MTFQQRLAELEAVIAQLKAENNKAAEALAANRTPPQLVQENAKLRRLLAEARSRLHSITHAPEGAVFVSKDDLRIIRACLHPDRAQNPEARHRYEAAFKAFNALPIRAV